MPSTSEAWVLISAQFGSPSPPVRSSSRPVGTTVPSSSVSYSRRKTWCEGCEV